MVQERVLVEKEIEVLTFAVIVAQRKGTKPKNKIDPGQNILEAYLHFFVDIFYYKEEERK
jgi:hypothetical protein